MNRRDFLASVGSLAVAALVPTWLKAQPAQINLQAFCHPEADASRFGNMNTPFVQGEAVLHKYATDGKVCVRVAAPEEYPLAEAVKRPPASGLKWAHDDLRGWKPWPRQDWIEAADADCLTCEGYGALDRRECETCEGYGQVVAGSNVSGRFYAKQCNKCKGRGKFGRDCPDCVGRGKNPIDVYPAYQQIGDQFIAVKYDRLLRKELGAMEYARVGMVCKDKGGDLMSLVAIRFNGGLGLLCPLDKKRAEENIRKANS